MCASSSLFSHQPAKKRQKKDPNAPKKPMSAYMLWMNANRDRIKEEHPGSTIGDIAKRAGEQWKLVSTDARKVSGFLSIFCGFAGSLILLLFLLLQQLDSLSHLNYISIIVCMDSPSSSINNSHSTQIIASSSGRVPSISSSGGAPSILSSGGAPSIANRWLPRPPNTH